MRKPVGIVPFVVFAIAMLHLCDPAAVLACPTCKDGLSNHTALGYAISILFMMGMPFLILSFWTVTIVRLRRLAAQLNDQPKLSDGSSRSERCADRISSSATA